MVKRDGENPFEQQVWSSLPCRVAVHQFSLPALGVVRPQGFPTPFTSFLRKAMIFTCFHHGLTMCVKHPATLQMIVLDGPRAAESEQPKQTPSLFLAIHFEPRGYFRSHCWGITRGASRMT